MSGSIRILSPYLQGPRSKEEHGSPFEPGVPRVFDRPREAALPWLFAICGALLAGPLRCPYGPVFQHEKHDMAGAWVPPFRFAEVLGWASPSPLQPRFDLLLVLFRSSAFILGPGALGVLRESSPRLDKIALRLLLCLKNSIRLDRQV